jgi:lipopolysaccharide export system permease protein
MDDLSNNRESTHMSVLFRYIIKEVLKGALVALLVLTTLVCLFTLKDQMGDVGKGSYDMKHLLMYLGLLTPLYIYELMPSAALLGSLFVLGNMANNREIVAMRVSGMSIVEILKAVLLAGAFLALVAVALGEFIAPQAEKQARVMKDEAVNENIVMNTLYGLWLRDGNTFVNVVQIADEGLINDLTLYEYDENRKLRFVKHAQQAIYLEDEKKWVLQKIIQAEITPDQVIETEKEIEDWTSRIDPNLMNIVVIKPDNMPLKDLSSYIDFLKDNNQQTKKYELAFWKRIVKPLVIFVMLLVSVPFVIGVRRGVSLGARMMAGALLGMGFNIIDKMTGNLALAYDLNPMIMAALPSSLVLIAAAFAMIRLR